MCQKETFLQGVSAADTLPRFSAGFPVFLYNIYSLLFNIYLISCHIYLILFRDSLSSFQCVPSFLLLFCIYFILFHIYLIFHQDSVPDFVVCVCVCARARVCVRVCTYTVLHTHTTAHTHRHKYTHGHLFVSLHFVPYGTERERGREGERDADTCSYRLISSLMASAPFLEARACILLSIIASQSLYCLVYVCVCVCVCVRIYVYSNTYIRVFIMANQRP